MKGKKEAKGMTLEAIHAELPSSLIATLLEMICILFFLI